MDSIFKRNFFSGKPDQTPHFAESDMAFHYLPMSNKKDTRLIWVNYLDIYSYMYNNPNCITCMVKLLALAF